MDNITEDKQFLTVRLNKIRSELEIINNRLDNTVAGLDYSWEGSAVEEMYSKYSIFRAKFDSLDSLLLQTIELLEQESEKESLNNRNDNHGEEND